ncbi:hypothetical protein ACF08N_13155 [Streptomyces sp. NPDC015127]|uniref:hypothetical protein n=1 Tax=Streptomyces sp. NPDC015127 TaxID=3364939 RepID=UPI0036F5DB4E
MPAPPRTNSPPRVPPAAAEALGSAARPPTTGMRVLLPAVSAVLPFALLRRRPLPALALMRAGSYAATVTAVTNPASPGSPLWPGPA